MTTYSKFSEDELFSEIDLIVSELEARLKMGKKETAEVEENEKLPYQAMERNRTPKATNISDTDMRKLYYTEHTVRLDDVYISTWWSPQDDRKIIDFIYSRNERLEESRFCDGISYEEFSTMVKQFIA